MTREELCVAACASIDSKVLMDKDGNAIDLGMYVDFLLDQLGKIRAESSIDADKYNENKMREVSKRAKMAIDNFIQQRLAPVGNGCV